MWIACASFEGILIWARTQYECGHELVASFVNLFVSSSHNYYEVKVKNVNNVQFAFLYSGEGSDYYQQVALGAYVARSQHSQEHTLHQTQRDGLHVCSDYRL